MVITKRHAIILKKLYEGGEEFSVEGWGDVDRETLWHLELAGLVRPAGVGIYDLTFSGNILGELLATLVSEKPGDPESWDESFRWVGSEVISMIRYSKQSRSKVRGEIEEELEKRGFAEGGNLNQYAYVLDEVYEASHPRLIIGEKLAEYLRSIPEGPGERKSLPIKGDELLQLEAMRLIAFSIPRSDVYALTGLGQQIRAALFKGLVVNDELVLDEIILDSVAKAYEGRKLSEPEKESLMERGILGFSGELLPAADHLYLAWKIYRVGPYLATPAFQIAKDEIRILETIEELWKKNETNPEIVPDDKRIKEEVEPGWEMKDYSVKLALYNLEGFGLIRSVQHSLGKKKILVYELTDHGRQVLEDQKGKRKGVSAVGVKSITMTKKEFAAPNVEWYERAKEEGLVSDRAPTKSGKLYARLSVEVERRPLVTKTEMKVLKRIPFTEGVFFEDLKLSEEEEIALEKLEAKNLVEILPTNLVVLTKAGQLFKRALSGVPEGMGTPITPIVIRLLQAIRKVGGLHVKENRIRIKPENWKQIEKEVGVDPDTFNDALLLAKNAKFIGKDSLTEAGRALLEGVDELSKREYEWIEL